MNAGGELALCDEGPSTLLMDNLIVGGATNMEKVDKKRKALAKDDNPLVLPRGNMLGVIVLVETEGIELVLEAVGDGKDESVVGR